MIGVSTQPVCGIRDYAATIAPALVAQGLEVETVWWNRFETPGGTSWLRSLESSAYADAVFWHYSPFAYGFHGIPTLTPRVAWAVRRHGRLVVLFHELAHDLGTRGLRGFVHGSAQRIALLPVMKSADGAIVTTDERAAWLTSRRWLPNRPIDVVRLPSGIPAVSIRPVESDSPPLVGIFGFRRSPTPPELVMAAVARAGVARLLLIGAPGPESPEAEAWRRAAALVGCSVDFTGVLPPDDLSRTLSGLTLAISTDRSGPTSRSSTIAALIAHGCPVVALDGPATWRPMADEGAVKLAEPSIPGLANALEGLLASPALLSLQGEQGRTFYERRLSPEAIGQQLAGFIGQVAR